MKITRVTAIPISIPSQRTLTALGIHPSFEYGVVTVETDEGITGIGDITMLWDGNGPLQCHYVNEWFGPKLVGEDPLALNRCIARMRTWSSPPTRRVPGSRSRCGTSPARLPGCPSTSCSGAVRGRRSRSAARS